MGNGEDCRRSMGPPSQHGTSFGGTSFALYVLLAGAEALSPPVLRALEVPTVLDALAQRARTTPGARLCRAATLAPSAEAARCRYEAVAEAMSSLQEEARPPLTHGLNLGPALEALQASPSRLTVSDLVDVGHAVSALSELAGWSELPAAARRTPLLAAQAARAAPPPRLARTLPTAFEAQPGGGYALSAEQFPVLRARRAAADAARAAVEAEAAGLLKSESFRAGLADPTQASPLRRDGRLVVAVRPENKHACGVEVARSRSGSTVFVEPHSLVRLSAAAREADASLVAAEARLLAALATLLRRALPDLLEAVDAAAELDAVLARGKLGAAWDGAVPTVGEGGRVRLPLARHPLLALGRTGREGRAAGGADAAEAVVGNTVELGGSGSGDGTGGLPQALMLTGPNGGGKSVVLKTVALLAVLARLGVPLPCASVCADGSAPVCDFFESISTDLDDSQSLAAGASSFTAHLRSCGAALEAAAAARGAGRHTMVVLDEPGASTDPAQGAAIARSVIESLLDSGALVLASTHSDALKTLGLADARIAVGSMSREPETGRPLYRMLLGCVGSSHALAAAEREGLPPPVLARARALMPAAEGAAAEQREEMESLLAALRESAAASGDDRAAAASSRARAEELHAGAAGSAAAAARSLSEAEAWLERRTRQLDEMLERLRGDGAHELELVGETVRGLRLAQRDAAAARRSVLTSLGLAPLGAGEILREGATVSYVPRAGEGILAAQGRAIEGVVVATPSPYASEVLISVGGAPPALVPRTDLATWAGGLADDFGAGWGGMLDAEPSLASSLAGTAVGGKRRKRR